MFLGVKYPGRWDMEKNHFDHNTIIVGGGAAGIVAAISARRAGASVLICEKMPKLGKKIRVSGNGRCNLLNDTIDASFYNSEAKELVGAVLDRFGKKEMLSFFKNLGLMVYSDEGRIFPVTNQAASVIEVLEMELSRLGVDIQCDCEVTGITVANSGFDISIKPDKRLHARKLILCGGGKSYPVSGSDGGAYALATHFGHRLIEPVPSTVPLVVNDPWCRSLHGQRIRAVVRSLIKARTGPKVEGELLFTEYGLSGTAILDASEEISIAINRLKTKEVSLIVDLLPSMHEEHLRKELSARLRKKFPPEKLLIGILPHKFATPLMDILKTGDPAAIANEIKNKTFAVDGVRGWDEAEFTAGRIDTSQVDPKTLESKLHRGLYLAGEILDVQGKRGGYNLAWAWASGYIAGSAAC